MVDQLRDRRKALSVERLKRTNLLLSAAEPIAIVACRTAPGASILGRAVADGTTPGT